MRMVYAEGQQAGQPETAAEHDYRTSSSGASCLHTAQPLRRYRSTAGATAGPTAAAAAAA